MVSSAQFAVRRSTRVSANLFLFSSLPTMSEPDTSGGSGDGAPEAVHFTAEQLTLIDRLIAAWVASSSVTTGGATAPRDPSTTTPSSVAGEYFLVAAPAVRKPRHRVATCFRFPTGEQPLGCSFAHLCFARARRPAGRSVLTCFPRPCCRLRHPATRALGEWRSHGWPVNSPSVAVGGVDSGGTGRPARVWLCFSKADKEDTGQGVRRHMGAAARGGDGGLVLPLQAPAAQPSDRHQCLDGMLCHDGGYSLCGIPGKGPTLLRLPLHHNQGQQDFRERGMGLVRHGVWAPGSQSGFPGLGAHRRSSLQRGVRWPRQTDSPLSIPTPRKSAPMLPSKPQLASGWKRAVRHLSTLQLPGWIQVSIPAVPVCTPMHEVQAPTPGVGVRRETPADTCREPADNGGGPGQVSPTLVGLSV